MSEKDMNDPLVRAEYLLRTVARFFTSNPIAEECTIVYDDAVCDGACLRDDCKVAAEELARVESQR